MQARLKQVNLGRGEGGGGALTNGYDVTLALNIFKTKFPSLLIMIHLDS